MIDIISVTDKEEMARRTARIAEALSANGIDAMLLSSFANLYYATGRVYCGYAYITASGEAYYFVKRPVGLDGSNVVYIRKPEQMAETLAANMPKTLALELGIASYIIAMSRSASLMAIVGLAVVLGEL